MTRLRLPLTVLLAAVFAFPLYFMVLTAVTPLADIRAGDYALLPTSPVLENFETAFSRFPIEQWFTNSVVIAVASVLITVTINVLCGYAFAKLRFPGRDVLFLLILSTLMIPIQVLMVPQFRIVADLQWVDSYWAVIVPRAAEAFGIFFARQWFRTIPDDLIEAARLDGASELQILRRVVLPLSGPLIAVLVIFTFMWRWNEFAWPLIVLKDSELYTLPIGMIFLKGQYATDTTAIMALALLTVTPIVLVFLAFQRRFVEGVVRTGLK